MPLNFKVRATITNIFKLVTQEMQQSLLLKNLPVGKFDCPCFQRAGVGGTVPDTQSPLPTADVSSFMTSKAIASVTSILVPLSSLCYREISFAKFSSNAALGNQMQCPGDGTEVLPETHIG